MARLANALDRRLGPFVEQMLSHMGRMPDEGDYGWNRPAYDEGALEIALAG